MLEHSFWYILLISNMTLSFDQIDVGNVLAPLWSIMVEIQFYFAIIPILIFFMKKKLKYVMYIAILLIIISLLYRYIASNPKFIYSFLIGRLDAFGFGILLGYLYFHFDIVKTLRHKFTQLTILIFILLTIGLSTSLGHPTYQDTSIFVYFFSSLGCFLILIFVLTNSIVSNIFQFNWFVYLGKISLGLYLFHTSSIYLIKIFNPEQIFEPYMSLFFGLLISIFMAHFSYKYFEKYFLNLKIRFEKVHH